MELKLVLIEKPEDQNVILGQAHFIKTVEDLYEAMMNAVPGIRFGLAFSEASQKRLIRTSGTDEELIGLAREAVAAVASGHFFVIMLGEGFFPLNVLHAVKTCPEVVRIFAATANPLSVVVAEEGRQRGVLGVLDGFSPLGVENSEDVAERRALLRQFGYKF